MATQEQTEHIFQAVRALRPTPFFQKMGQAQVGIGAVLSYLDECEGSVTAGKIAEFVGISTARVAVLLKKMEAKGLILKGRDPCDARITIVRLSEQGMATAQAMRSGIYSKVSEVIDRVGMERMMEFVAIAHEIAEIAPTHEIVEKE